MHRKNEGIPVSRFANQQACTGRIRDNNSHGKNPIRYHNQAGKISITFAVSDAILFAFADALFAFSVRSNNRSSITGQCQSILMDKSCGNRNIKELFLIDFKERRIRLFIKFKISFFLRLEEVQQP